MAAPGPGSAAGPGIEHPTEQQHRPTSRSQTGASRPTQVSLPATFLGNLSISKMQKAGSKGSNGPREPTAPTCPPPPPSALRGQATQPDTRCRARRFKKDLTLQPSVALGAIWANSCDLQRRTRRPPGFPPLRQCGPAQLGDVDAPHTAKAQADGHVPLGARGRQPTRRCARTPGRGGDTLCGQRGRSARPGAGPVWTGRGSRVLPSWPCPCPARAPERAPEAAPNVGGGRRPPAPQANTWGPRRRGSPCTCTGPEGLPRI